MRRHVIAVGFLIICISLLTGCLSRKLAVMDLNDTLSAIADELCGVPLKAADATANVELVTATGFTAGVDAGGMGIPIAVSGNVTDSTKITVDIKPRCPSDLSMRRTNRRERAVYESDTGTGMLKPLNDEAMRRLTKQYADDYGARVV